MGGTKLVTSADSIIKLDFERGTIKDTGIKG